MSAATDFKKLFDPSVAGLKLFVDAFEPFDERTLSSDPLDWPGYQMALDRVRQATGLDQAVIAGRAMIGTRACVVAAFDFRFFGGSMGEAEGQRIVSAVRVAARERLPLVTILSSGGARMQEGMRSLIQLPRVARALVELGSVGTPHVCVLRHPTTGGVWASIGAAADLILAEAGASVAFAGSRVRATQQADEAACFQAEAKLNDGFIDAVGSTEELRHRLGLAVELLSPESRGAPHQPPLPAVPRSGPPATGWPQVVRARRPDHPRADQYLAQYFSAMVEITGDRVSGVDDSVRCGFGRVNGCTVAFVAQQGGITRAAGYRTAQRLIELAEKFNLPILTLMDAPGSDSSAAGERQGIGTAIARLYQAVAALTVPILSLTIGQGGSGGTLSLAAPDNIWLTADSYFSVIAPESATAILKRPAEDLETIAEQLRLGPEELWQLGVARGVLEG